MEIKGISMWCITIHKSRFYVILCMTSYQYSIQRHADLINWFISNVLSISWLIQISLFNCLKHARLQDKLVMTSREPGWATIRERVDLLSPRHVRLITNLHIIITAIYGTSWWNLLTELPKTHSETIGPICDWCLALHYMIGHTCCQLSLVIKPYPTFIILK